MQYFCSVFMGCLTVVSMYCAIQYYLPHILAKLPSTAGTSDAELPSGENVQTLCLHTPAWSRRSTSRTIMLVSGALYGVLVGYFIVRGGSTWVQCLEAVVVFLVLAIVFVTDLAYHVIPNLLPLAIVGVRACVLVGQLILRVQYAGRDVRNSFIVMILITLVLLMVNRITHGGMGFGDVKLISAIGFMSGLRDAMYTLLFSFLICMLASTFLLLIKKKTMKDTIPLGPFIWIGYGIALIINRL